MPLFTIPAAVSAGMTAAEAAAAAAAAASATTAVAAPTLAAAAPTAALTSTAVAPTLASTTALPGVMGGTGALGGAGSAGSVLTGAGGLSSGASTLAGLPGAAGAETLAAASPEIAGNLAAAGNTGVMSGATGATGAEALTAGAGEGIMTDAGAMQSGALNMGSNVPANEIGRAQIAEFMGQPPVAPTTSPVYNPAAPFANPTPQLAGAPGAPPPGPFSYNPTGAPQIGGMSAERGMPGNPMDPNANLLRGIDIPYEPQAGIDVPYQSSTGNAFERGIKSAIDFAKNNPNTMMAGSLATSYLMRPKPPEKKQYGRRDLSGFQRSEPSAGVYTPVYQTSANYAVGGQVEQMAAMNAVGANTGYPMAALQTPMYANPAVQRPEATNVVAPSVDAGVGAYTGEQKFAEGGDVPAVEKLEAHNKKMLGIKTPQEIEEDFQRGQDVMRQEGFGIVTDRDVDTQRKSPMAASIAQLKKIGKRTGTPVTDMPKSGVIDTDVFHAAQGGVTYGLGGYSDGGRLLKGPGDGVSDSIPASIGGRQPARLADGEFVVPARIVSELGNGSTEAGARKLYAMMERVQKARKKSVGKDKVAVNSKADKHLPA